MLHVHCHGEVTNYCEYYCTESIEKDIMVESTQDHLNLIGPLSFDLRNSCTVLLYANLIKATFTIKACEIIIILLLFP